MYYKCSICEWIYNEEKEGRLFSELPESYTCPICGAPKDRFFETDNSRPE
ncbi:MAG: rubredoxin [Heliobacteriaceae bacterium]|jgi:pyruvate oxidase|nr:rubredoxin [Heliobacteriaceae bacterium]